LVHQVEYQTSDNNEMYMDIARSEDIVFRLMRVCIERNMIV